MMKNRRHHLRKQCEFLKKIKLQKIEQDQVGNRTLVLEVEANNRCILGMINSKIKTTNKKIICFLAKS